MNVTLQRRRLIAVLLIVIVAISAAVLIITKQFNKQNNDYANIPAYRYVVPRPYLPGQRVSALAFSPSGTILAVGASQEILYYVRVPDLHPFQIIDKVHGDINFLAWSSNGQNLAIGDGTGMNIWNVKKVSLKRRLSELSQEPKFAQYIGNHIASPDATLVASGQPNGTITVWNATTGKQLFKHQHPAMSAYSATYHLCGIAFSPDNQRLATAILKGPALSPRITLSLTVSDANTGKTINSWDWKESPLESDIGLYGNLGDIGLAFSPDGRTLASSNASAMALWTIKTGYHIRTMHATEPIMNGLEQHIQFFPDGNRVAANGAGPYTYIWNVNSGRLVQVFHGVETSTALAISPDGHWLATGGQDKNGEGILSLWDVSRLQ